MIAVSGCPRSGTSVMMLCMRELVGEEQVIGTRFPQEERMERMRRRGPGETEAHYRARLYSLDRQNPHWEEELQESKDLNPAGFWECPWTVRGVKYLRGMREEWEKADSEKVVCKVVSQGLPGSNVEKIHRVVFMIRHPYDVAKSQERLQRGPRVQVGGRGQRLGRGFQVITPEMFTAVTAQAARFFLENPELPRLVVEFDELIENPRPTLEQVGEFIGVEDVGPAVEVIEPGLRRSHGEELLGELWKEALEVWELLKARDWEGIVEKVDAGSRTARERAGFYCPRVGKPVVPRQCMLCYEGEVVTQNFRHHAATHGVEWREEPCLWESGMCPDDPEPMEMEESTGRNFFEEARRDAGRQRVRRKPEIKESLARLEKSEIGERLEALCRDHGLLPEVAAEIETELLGE